MWKFSNYSLKYKLFIIIFICIIIPLLFIGTFFSRYISNLESKNRCDSDLRILAELETNIDKILNDVMELDTAIIINGWLQKILKGTESAKDYKELSDYYDNATRNKDYFISLCLSSNKEILFQRGLVLKSESDSFINRLEERELVSYWSEPHSLDLYPFKRKGYNKEAALTYYHSITQKTINNEYKGVLSISISEDSICNTYSTYLSNDSKVSFLIRNDGVILSSTDKKQLGQVYPEFGKLSKHLKGSSGYFKDTIANEKMIVFYSKSEVNEWYLINILPQGTYSSINQTFYFIALLVILLCMLFGGVFTLIQQKYIIKPLINLLNQMNKLKSGNLEIEMENYSKDEIGKIREEFVNLSKQINNLIHEVYIAKIYNQEAELKLLTSQINPHFLYNTLDSIHWLAVKNKDYDVSEQIEALADVFRHSLNQGRDMVTIEDEINHINNYMFIMNSRYKSRAKLVINMEHEIYSVKIPKLILQPLVENAMLHGLEPKVEGGKIEVSINRNDNLLIIRVKDDGVGADENLINKQLNDKEENHNVFALKNLDQRIKIKYGQDYGLQFYSVIGEGTTVTVTIPLKED